MKEIHWRKKAVKKKSRDIPTVSTDANDEGSAGKKALKGRWEKDRVDEVEVEAEEEDETLVEGEDVEESLWLYDGGVWCFTWTIVDPILQGAI